MNKQLLTGQWEFFRMVLTVTRKLVEQIPADKLISAPRPMSARPAKSSPTCTPC